MRRYLVSCAIGGGAGGAGDGGGGEGDDHLRPQSTFVLNPTIRSVVTGNQWSGPMKLGFIGPLHWFPIATDRIFGLSPKVDWGRDSLTHHTAGKVTSSFYCRQPVTVRPVTINGE